jgi:hypothetical protein
MDAGHNPYRPPRARVDVASESAADLGRVMSGQRLVLYAALAHLLSLPLQAAAGAFASLALSLVALVLSIFGIVRLGGGLGMLSVTKLVLSLLMFVPLANLIALLVLNRRATRVLREAGHVVGWLGVSR